ncbi:hypothetical protein GCM10009565_02240 [Amycolatopsis albidoflavus]
MSEAAANTVSVPPPGAGADAEPAPWLELGWSPELQAPANNAIAAVPATARASFFIWILPGFPPRRWSP